MQILSECISYNVENMAFFTSSPGGGRIDGNVNGSPLMSLQGQKLRRGRIALYFLLAKDIACLW